MNILVQSKEKYELIPIPLFIQTYWLLTFLHTTALYKKNTFFVLFYS